MTVAQVSKFILYSRLMRLDKPVGIYLLLWPVLWALWVASLGIPDFKILVVFMLGTVVMRSAGCVINDYADRNVDGAVERTKLRPLALGLVSKNEAMGLFGLLGLSAFVLVVQLNWQTVLLSTVGLGLAVIYPFMKRVTHCPQVVLGAAFAWSIPMAFMAVRESVSSEAYLLFLATLLWTVAYDTQYAMVDRKDDVKIGIKSTAILFGRYDRVIIGLLQLASLSLLYLVGIQLALPFSFFFSLLVASGFFIYQMILIKDRVPTNCFRAFLNNQWVGLIIFLGFFGAFW